MKIRFGYLLGVTAACILVSAPVQARRTAIDTRPDGSQLRKELSGYCDLDGIDCGTANLGYNVSFDGGASFITSVGVAGNGLLTFGNAIDFDYAADPAGQSLRSQIQAANDPDSPDYNRDPALTDYGLNLVSAGQNNAIDTIEPANDGRVFYQSADLHLNKGVIRADWFTCAKPQPKLCRDNPYSVTLTPTPTGFSGLFDFSKGNGSNDVGYVVNGRQTLVQGNRFFLPATITGLVSAVPEPASWAMMIAGFGMIGGALRRRSTRSTPAFA